jgi:hypothetical protein
VRSRIPNWRLWNAGSRAQQADDLLRIGPLLQFLKDEHLILVRAVDRRLTRGHALAWNDDGLNILEKVIISIHARRGCDDDTAGAAVDGDHGPGGKRGGRQREKRQREQQDTAHENLQETRSGGLYSEARRRWLWTAAAIIVRRFDDRRQTGGAA